MSKKKMIMIGMVVGSFAGGSIPSFFGVHSFSLISLLGSMIGGVCGIWLAYKFA